MAYEKGCGPDVDNGLSSPRILEEELSKVVSDVYEPSLTPKELKKVSLLEMNGTKNEVLPANV